MSHAPAPPAASGASAPGAPELPQLSRRSFAFALAITLAIFFLLHPFWEPLDMDAMDASIAWSYAPIPLLVLGLLALERKLRWSSWLLETLRLTLVKFVITFLFANLMWAFVDPPAPVVSSPQAPQLRGTPSRFEPRPPPPATLRDPADGGRLTGLVVDDAGVPRSGVLVAVTDGLQAFAFAPPTAALELQHDGSRLQPPFSVLQTYQPLLLRGVADALHTVRATDPHGRQLFNMPLLPDAAPTLMFDRPSGRVLLTCAVHGAAESGSELLVLHHPFWTWTGEDGTFHLPDVPAAALQVSALRAGRDAVSVELTLQPGERRTDLLLTLP